MSITHAWNVHTYRQTNAVALELVVWPKGNRLPDNSLSLSCGRFWPRCFVVIATHFVFLFRFFFFPPLLFGCISLRSCFNSFIEIVDFLIHWTGFFSRRHSEHFSWLWERNSFDDFVFIVVVSVVIFSIGRAVVFSFQFKPHQKTKIPEFSRPKIRKTPCIMCENFGVAVYLVPSKTKTLTATTTTKNWFVLTPMLENLLIFQVTSENMTGIRLFPELTWPEVRSKIHIHSCQVYTQCRRIERWWRWRESKTRTNKHEKENE